MQDYQSNSNRNRENKEIKDKKKVKKVVTGVVKVKKESKTKKFMSAFLYDDITKIKDSVLFEVLMPSFKKVITDIIDVIFSGEAKHGNKSESSMSRPSFRNYNDTSNNHLNSRSNSRDRIQYNYEKIVLESRGEAEMVIMQMDEIVSSYGFATVADLHDTLGITGNYTDVNYGWTNLRTADYTKVMDGYLLRFPRPLPID